MATSNDTLDHVTLVWLIEEGAVTRASIVGQPGGWSIVIQYGMTERALAAKRGAWGSRRAMEDGTRCAAKAGRAWKGLILPVWKPAAIADRKRIIAYIANDNVLAVIDMGNMLMLKAVQLDMHPKQGRIGRVRGIRELIVDKNHILIYRMIDAVVEILRVKHASQQNFA